MRVQRWGAVLGLLAVTCLTACGSDEPADETAGGSAGPTRNVTALDESFTLEVPEGWTTKDEFLGAPVVVAVQGDSRFDQVLVSHYFDEVRAEEEAISSGGMLSGSNVFCERLDDTTVFGDERLVFDCPVEGGQETTRKLFFPVVREGEKESALVLIQTTGATIEDTADVVQPILESFAWQ